MREALEIFGALRARLGDRLHAFGLKRQGLGLARHLLKSADSMAWSYRARRSPPLTGCTHKSCANCMIYALLWREETLRRCRPAPLYRLLGV
jgi:hypothetical protein